MHQFAFFSLSLFFGISFSCRCWFGCSTEISRGCPVRVCFVIQITGFTRYKVPTPKVLSVYPREPQIVSYSDREFSPLGALSRLVSERTLPPYLCPTYCHTPPQHRSSPLSFVTALLRCRKRSSFSLRSITIDHPTTCWRIYCITILWLPSGCPPTWPTRN